MTDFENAIEDWESHDDWRYADRDAERKFFYLAGQASAEQRVNEQAMQLAVYGSELAAIQAKCAELERERDEWKDSALTWETVALKAQAGEPVKFLCDGTRFKISRDAYHGTGCQLLGLPDELQGEWVALVEATDNCHMKLTHPTTERRAPEDDVYRDLMDAHAKELDRAMEILRRCETEMGYAGWGKLTKDNVGRRDVYGDVCEFLHPESNAAPAKGEV